MAAKCLRTSAGPMTTISSPQAARCSASRSLVAPLIDDARPGSGVMPSVIGDVHATTLDHRLTDDLEVGRLRGRLGTPPIGVDDDRLGRRLGIGTERA